MQCLECMVCCGLKGQGILAQPSELGSGAPQSLFALKWQDIRLMLLFQSVWIGGPGRCPGLSYAAPLVRIKAVWF